MRLIKMNEIENMSNKEKRELSIQILLKMQEVLKEIKNEDRN